MNLELYFPDGSKEQLNMKSIEKGFHSAAVEAPKGLEYMFVIDGKKKRPDPASRFQPNGVHGHSAIVLPETFEWHDRNWRGTPRNVLILYELHVGTFTSEGTFGAILSHLDYFKELGITAIELMPVGQFPGTRNWGYDGVDLFAPQNSYGGPVELKRLVDGCHQKELSLFLDVVYNHVGPEGNYFADYGPFFSEKYTTPWGPAINYDGAGSDEVRKFVVQNAVYWINEFHLDGLRLDAVDKIFDFSPRNILLEIEENVHQAAEVHGREVHVIAESDLNDPKLILPKKVGGYSLDAQWSDDFHHAVHAYLTGERFHYFADFGEIDDIAKALSSSFVYDGQYSAFRDKMHGSTAGDLGGEKFVFCLQNHDQVGNHPDGSRLSLLLNFDKLKVAVGLLILSQSIPLLFMGEEYRDNASFHYFVSHSKEELVKVVREGRKKDHQYLSSEREYLDPQAESTFLRSKLNHSLRSKESNIVTFEYYRDLIRLRKELLPLRILQRTSQEIILIKERRSIIMNRSFGEDLVRCYFVLSENPEEFEDPSRERLKLVFDSTNYEGRSIPLKSQRISREASKNQITLPPMSVTVFAK